MNKIWRRSLPMMLMGLAAILLHPGAALAQAKSDPLDMPADAYLAGCDRGDGDCTAVITLEFMYFMLNPQASKTTCIPDAPDDDAAADAQDEKFIKDVVAWLHTHPSPQGWTANQAVGNAIHSLYPCGN